MLSICQGFPCGLVVKNLLANTGDANDTGSSLRSGRSPGKKWQTTPVFLPGEFHGQRSLVGYSPWGCKESDRTELLRAAHIYMPSTADTQRTGQSLHRTCIVKERAHTWMNEYRRNHQNMAWKWGWNTVKRRWQVMTRRLLWTEESLWDVSLKKEPGIWDSGKEHYR